MQCRASISLSSSSGSDISQMMSYNSLIIEQSFHYTINSSNYWIMDFTWNLTSIPSMTSAGLVFNLIILLVYLKIATLYQMRFKGLKSVVNWRTCLLFTVFENHRKSIIEHCDCKQNKFIENAKNCQFGELWKTWSLQSNSVIRQVNLVWLKLMENAKKKSNAKFWVIFKHCVFCFFLSNVVSRL